VFGRLGEPGRPSYAALELRTSDGERLLAGVRLVRGAEPSVELTPFLIAGLPPETRLADLLLERKLDGDHVPELDAVAAAARAAGATFTSFRSARDYFAALFERGVLPMRLGADDERGKFNELLRASMTGGISRSLTGELRGFLLREETGLGDALARMRGDLDACRRTRLEVAEARVLERDIAAVFEAGLAMFTSAVLAVRGAAREAERAAAAAEAELARLAVDEVQLRARATAAAAACREHEAQLAAARARLAQAHADAARQAQHADAVARCHAGRAEVAALAAPHAATQATWAAMVELRDAARQRRDEARDAYAQAGRGLADLQAGLDELARRAAAHRRLHRHLDEAASALGEPAPPVGQLEPALAQLRARRAELAHARLVGDRALADLGLRRAEHAEALAALAALGGDPALPPMERARARLAELAAADLLVARHAQLARELADVELLATRQDAAFRLAEAAGVVGGPVAVAQALAAAEAEQRRHDDASRTRRDALAALPSAEQLADELAALEARAAQRQRAIAAAAQLGALAPRSPSPEDVAAMQRTLAQRHAAHAAEMARLDAVSTDLRRARAELERGAPPVAPALRALADQLGGTLLRDRLAREGLDEAAARWLEARLGPRLDAIVVDDLAAVLATSPALPDGLDEAWLIDGDAALELTPPADESAVTQVITDERHGVRLARLGGGQGALGPAAFAARVAAATAAETAHGAALEAAAVDAHRHGVMARAADELVALAEAWRAPDPAPAIAAARQRLATIAVERAELDEQRAVSDDAVARCQRTVALLRQLLPDAALLDDESVGTRLHELRRDVGGLVEREAELHALAAPRAVVAMRLDALRRPPPDDDEAAAAHRAQAERDRAIDMLSLAITALDEAHRLAPAATWADAATALTSQAALSPALEQQHELARVALAAADASVDIAERRLGEAVAAAQAATGELTAARAQLARAEADLAALGGEHRPPGADVAGAAAAVEALERAAADLHAARALADERVARARAAHHAATSALATAQAATGPAIAAWDQLQADAAADDLLAAVLTEHGAGPSVVLATAEAWSGRQVLVDRVGRSRGADDLLATLRDLPLDGPGYLEAWRATRAWLRRRVPAQIAEVADPLEALQRLRGHLDVLERRLERQELALRGSSEDIARGIDVQVRRAHAQVRRLTAQLAGVAFGSIGGIRVEIRRVDRMEQVLRALRAGAAQELLFLAAMPIEEALDEVFRRYGGGGRGGGQRLLDYREYVELVVEVQRAGKPDWEPASPTRLSTGEAIGVGAAVMMVVLTAWERDAQLLRPQRGGGTVRFLFLDEANRLSRDNLGVLFELCRVLDLQLLVAAPEVAHAEGNTTYRLVRHVDDAGREEVLVSGRRAAPAEA
jgi:chromosome partition protein MukB